MVYRTHHDEFYCGDERPGVADPDAAERSSANIVQAMLGPPVAGSAQGVGRRC